MPAHFCHLIFQLQVVWAVQYKSMFYYAITTSMCPVKTCQKMPISKGNGKCIQYKKGNLKVVTIVEIEQFLGSFEDHPFSKLMGFRKKDFRILLSQSTADTDLFPSFYATVIFAGFCNNKHFHFKLQCPKLIFAFIGGKYLLQ